MLFRQIFDEPKLGRARVLEDRVVAGGMLGWNERHQPESRRGAHTMTPSSSSGAASSETLDDSRHRGDVSAALERMTGVLQSMDQRLARLEAGVARAEPIAMALTPAIGTVVDACDGIVVRLAERGVDVDARARQSLLLLEKLTAPSVLGVIGSLADRVEGIEALVAMMDRLPGMVAIAVDTFDSVVDRMRVPGSDLDDRLQRLLVIGDRLTQPGTLAAVESLLDADAIAVLGNVGRALAETGLEPSERVGIFGLLRALRDPEVQRAAGFLVALARRFGAALPAHARRALPAAD